MKREKAVLSADQSDDSAVNRPWRTWRRKRGEGNSKIKIKIK